MAKGSEGRSEEGQSWVGRRVNWKVIVESEGKSSSVRAKVLVVSNERKKGRAHRFLG